MIIALCLLSASVCGVKAFCSVRTAPPDHGRNTMQTTYTDVHLTAAFKYYLDNDDLEGLVSDLQIYLGEYIDEDQLEDLSIRWVEEIEASEEEAA